MEEFIMLFSNTVIPFTEYLLVAQEGILTDAPGLIPLLQNASVVPFVDSEKINAMPSEECLFTMLSTERTFAETIQRGSSAANIAPEHWLSQFSPVHVTNARELKKNAATAYSKYVLRIPAIRNKFVKTIADKISMRYIDKWDQVGDLLQSWAHRYDSSHEILFLAEALITPENRTFLRPVISLLRYNTLTATAKTFAKFHNDTGEIAIITMGERIAVKSTIWNIRLASRNSQVYDTKALYDKGELERRKIRYEPNRGLDVNVLPRFRILTSEDIPEEKNTNIITGIGSVLPRNLPISDSLQPFVVHIGKKIQTILPSINTREETAINSCFMLPAISFLDDQWKSFAELHAEHRVGEDVPLRAFERVATAELNSIIIKILNDAPDNLWNSLQIEILNTQAQWLISAADEAYHVSAEAWLYNATHGEGISKERLISRATQTYLFVLQVNPLFAAYWRAAVTEDKLLTISTSDLLHFVKNGTMNALGNLITELSVRRAELLVFREPLVCAAANIRSGFA